jgi:3-methyladenine DNA glycosylase AlkD
VSASLPPLAEALAPAVAEHWGLVRTLGRNIGHIMEELTDMGFALDALDKMVSSKSKEIRAAACWALAEVGAERPENVTGLAYRLAKDDAWEVRDQIAAAYDERIGPAQPRPLLEIMRRWSNDGDERVRRAPALALIRRARRDRTPVLAILETLRRDNSIYVRKGVVYCLQQAWGRAENPSYGPPTPDSPLFLLRVLREWAKDSSSNTRWVAAYTLAHTWVAPYLPDALSIIRLVARDSSEIAQKAAQAALLGLSKLGNPSLRRTLETWAADHYEQTVSQLARRVLAELPPPEVAAAPVSSGAPALPPHPAANGQRNSKRHRRARSTPPHPFTQNGATATLPAAASNITPTEADQATVDIDSAAAPEAAPPVATIAPSPSPHPRRVRAAHAVVGGAATAVETIPAAASSPPLPPTQENITPPETTPPAATEASAAPPTAKKRTRKPRAEVALADNSDTAPITEESVTPRRSRKSALSAPSSVPQKEEGNG